MDGPKQTTTQNSRSEPWAPTQGLLNNLIGTIGNQYGGGANMGAGFSPGIPGIPGLPPGASIPEGLPAGKRMNITGGQTGGGFDVGINPAQSAALDSLTANAPNAGRYAPELGLLAGDLFRGGTDRTGMVQGAYDTLKTQLSPYATADTNPYTNEAFTWFTSGLQGDITDQIKSQYAGAGYSPVRTGDFGQQVGQGVAKGVAPVWLDAYNQMEGRKLGAIQGLYGAGNTTAGILSGQDQMALQNRLAGANVGQAQFASENAPAQQALAIEAMRRGIPLQNIAQLSSLIIPMAQLGQQQSGTSTTETQIPMGQQLLGLGLAGAGLASGLGAFGAPAGLLGGLNPLSAAGQAFGAGINPGVAGGGYVGAGGLYPGPGWYGGNP